MPRKIAYVGFGELGKQISLFIKQTYSDIEEEIFFDDKLASLNGRNAYSFNEYENDKFSVYEFYVCLGYKQPDAKADILARLKDLKRNIGTFIHPNTIVNPTAEIRSGVVIYPGCNIDQHVVIAEGVLLNNSVTVSHNSFIGVASFLAPGVTVCGNVTVGTKSFIGSGSVISNDVRIGDDVIVGPGSVVTKEISSGSSVIGNPLRLLSKKLVLK